MSARPGRAQASHKAARHDGTNWQDRAACYGLGTADDDPFFPNSHQRISPIVRRTCKACEVQDACLAYALAHDEWFGVWGGLSVEERKVIARGGQS